MIATATKTARLAGSTAIPSSEHCARYGPSFAAGEPDSAKLEDVLSKLHETSLTQLVEDHSGSNLEGKVRQAALD